MNPRRISLLLLAVNCGLLGVTIYMVYTMKIGPSLGSTPPRARVVTNTVTQIAVRKINATNLLSAFLTNRWLNWRAIESTNYAIYIDNLRSVGCPEETVRDIIITDIAKLYARRRSDLRAQLHPYRFWETADPISGAPPNTPELQRQLRQLDKEQRQLVHELLGVDFRAEIAKYWDEEASAERDYSFLPPEKHQRVLSVAEKYEELEQEIYGRSRGLLLPEDQEALRQLQRQRRAELAGILAPEELEEYELRHSETANNMRTQLAGFQPTEEEFRKIFRLQRAFDDNFDQAFDTRDDGALALKARAQREAQAALNQEIQKILGPERLAQYQRAQDADYRALLQLGDRFELPGDVANKVYAMKQASEQYKLQVESSPNLSEEQRAQAMAALGRETERWVAATMGDTVFQAYQKTSGQWLGNLAVVDETVVPPPPQPAGTILPYDINLLPPDLRNYLLNPPVFPRPAK